jgi:hypothetical protein
LTTTEQQTANLQREIECRKNDARQQLVEAFWYTRTRSELFAYDEAAEQTPEYTLPLPEFQAFVRELVSLD